MTLVIAKLAIAAITMVPHSEKPPKPKPVAPHRLFIIERHRLPHALRATLKRLRGCETRGIPFPLNYSFTGPHFGAYQYTLSTWGRTVPFLPHRLQRHASHAPARPERQRHYWRKVATPAEQDVRTAFFFPSHRSEWACTA